MLLRMGQKQPGARGKAVEQIGEEVGEGEGGGYSSRLPALAGQGREGQLELLELLELLERTSREL